MFFSLLQVMYKLIHSVGLLVQWDHGNGTLWWYTRWQTAQPDRTNYPTLRWGQRTPTLRSCGPRTGIGCCTAKPRVLTTSTSVYALAATKACVGLSCATDLRASRHCRPATFRFQEGNGRKCCLTRMGSRPTSSTAQIQAVLCLGHQILGGNTTAAPLRW